MEHGLRSCLLASRLAESLGLSDQERRTCYYVALLRWVGCTSDAHLLAAWFGDDLQARGDGMLIDFGSPAELLAFTVRHVGAGRSPRGRAASIAALVGAGPGTQAETARGSCEVARLLARRLGLDDPVEEALNFTFERWDGRGAPARAAGEAIPLAARVVQVTDVAEVLVRHDPGGVEAELRRRAGKALDPGLVRHYLAEIAGTESSGQDSWTEVLAADPDPSQWLEEPLDDAFAAIADFTDLKSPHLAGHSRAVAGVTVAAARSLGADRNALTTLRHAALVHDLGTVGLPNSILDKPGPLIAPEWERVRLHPYYTERVFSRSRFLAPIGNLASLHHERLDGSGYHRGAAGAALPPEARLLAAAESYCAMTEARAHRPAFDPAAAARELRAEATRGRLDGPAVEAIVAAAGHRTHQRKPWPFGLTEREVDVLRLMASGQSTKGIAKQLSISAKTADHHVQHIYGKLEVTSRPAAALLAMENGLLGFSQAGGTVARGSKR
jgi:HD-GYP domain-containing protein (c-di-GMP phosphodiesterase class II)/DNA-binding CsgD family transcriptional regulator